MKTTKTFCTAILALLTMAASAQVEESLFVRVEYSQELNRFETWVSNVYDRINHNSNEEADLPVISQSYYSGYAVVSYENEPTMENWMSAPFEEVLFEGDLSMEAWMSTPFKTEEALEVEAWMTKALWE